MARFAGERTTRHGIAASARHKMNIHASSELCAVNRLPSKITQKSRNKRRADFLPYGAEFPEPILQHRAPTGTYLLDKVVEELRECGIYPNLDDLLHRVRYEMDWARASSMAIAAYYYLFEPKLRHQTARLFEDLSVITHLIERNKNVSSILIGNCITARLNGPKQYENPLDATQRLMCILSSLNKEIKRYTSAFQKESAKCGNYDHFSSWFITNAFDSWIGFRSKGFSTLVPEDVERLSKEHVGLFSRLLAAAWRDMGLPLTDHRGHSREPLEGWFADSIRKRKLIGLQPPKRKLTTDDFEPNSLDI
jgi:hypothetical protein